MCLDLISIVFQVCILADNNMLKTTVRHLLKWGTTGKAVTAILANRIGETMHNATHKEDQPVAASALIGWSDMKCFIRCGGFHVDDAQYLLALLWQDREGFLIANTSALSPRYASIVYVLWQYLVHISWYVKSSLARMTLSNGVPCSSAETSLWKAVYELAHRCWLTATESEVTSLQFIAHHVEFTVLMYTLSCLPESRTTDSDSQNIVQAFIKRLICDPPNSKAFRIEHASTFMHYTNLSVMNIVDHDYDMVSTMHSTILKRVWDYFDYPVPVGMDSKLVYYVGDILQNEWLVRARLKLQDLFAYFFCYRLLLDRLSAKRRSMRAQDLYAEDCMNLVGRSLLVMPEWKPEDYQSDEALGAKNGI